jgi:hypothetical protein
MAALPRALQHLKGRSSHKLLSELCCASATGVSICGRGANWVVSTGNVTDGHVARIHQEPSSARA